MSTERLHWNPGPPPAPDGLREAFRHAQHRRMRTAATAALPVVMSAVVLASLPFAGGTPTSLDVDPAHRPTATTPGARDARTTTVAHGRPASAGIAAAHGGAATSEGNAGWPGRADTAPASPLPTILPTGGPTRPELAYLDVSATGTKSTHVDLPDALNLDAGQTTFTTDGAYAALYVVSDDGLTEGGVFLVPLPERDTRTSTVPVVETVGSFGTLPAGGYTAYVVGTGSVHIRIPLHGEGSGITAVASDPATARFGQADHAFAPAAMSGSVRLPVTGGATSVGIAGSWMYGNKTNSAVDACLAAHAAECTPDDPANDSGSTVSTGSEGAIFAIAKGALATERDVLAHGTATTTADTHLWVWYVVLDL